jgi:hypothetical protein
LLSEILTFDVFQENLDLSLLVREAFSSFFFFFFFFPTADFFLYSPRTACCLTKKEKQSSLGSCQKEQMQPQHGAPDPGKWHHNTLFVKRRTENFSSPHVLICILLGTQ